ncbi:MAG: hypothetical protein AAGC73_03210 [Verrucomicrobiota bacterium]
MPQDPNHSPEKIDLDELLRLKRSERPSEPVWEQFDRELHQRMLQTLMKKEPWYLQVFRALTGRAAQGGFAAVAAVFAVIMVGRTAFIASGPMPDTQLAQADVAVETSQMVAASEFLTVTSTDLIDAEIMATPDYAIETYSAVDVAAGAGFMRDFGMDRIETANYDDASYSADTARSRASFANTSVASIAF